MDNISNTIHDCRSIGKKVLSVYFTAGFPNLNDTKTIITELEKHGANMIEIGLPFSDPLADGPVIQHSSGIAIKNGMNANVLFDQLNDIRTSVKIPLIIMAYLNPLQQFGIDDFCRRCTQVGIDGLIIPDLPPEQYERDFQETFEKYGLKFILLITPETPEARIRYIDSLSTGFIYMVSSAGVTGNTKQFAQNESQYFERIANMRLKNPCLAGFGIHDKVSFDAASRKIDGAIIGSAFIRELEKNGIDGIGGFVRQFG